MFHRDVRRYQKSPFSVSIEDPTWGDFSLIAYGGSSACSQVPRMNTFSHSSGARNGVNRDSTSMSTSSSSSSSWVESGTDEQAAIPTRCKSLQTRLLRAPLPSRFQFAFRACACTLTNGHTTRATISLSYAITMLKMENLSNKLVSLAFGWLRCSIMYKGLSPSIAAKEEAVKMILLRLDLWLSRIFNIIFFTVLDVEIILQRFDIFYVHLITSREYLQTAKWLFELTISKKYLCTLSIIDQPTSDSSRSLTFTRN